MVPRTPPRRCLQLFVKYTVYPPSQTYQQHALEGGGSGLWGSSCRPSRIGRRSGPVPVAYRLHGRWRVAPAARRLQQARVTVPWVASQLQARVQPVQLVRALGGGPPPHAIAQHSRPAPSRTARPTRCVPYRLQAVRLSWHCCAPPRRGTRPAAGRGCRARCARRGHPGAPPDSPTPPRRARPTRRVPHGSQVVRSSWPCRVARGTLSTQPPLGQNCNR